MVRPARTSGLAGRLETAPSLHCRLFCQPSAISTRLMIAGLTTLPVSVPVNQALSADVTRNFSGAEKLNLLSALPTCRDLSIATQALVGRYLLGLSRPSLIYRVLAVTALSFSLKLYHFRRRQTRYMPAPTLQPDGVPQYRAGTVSPLAVTAGYNRDCRSQSSADPPT